MPENTTGNSEGRSNIRPSGVAPGRVRIDIAGWNVTFTTSTGQVYPDRADTVEMMLGGEAHYTCASGRSWTAPRDWVSGDTVSINNFNNWVVTDVPWTEPRYFAGGYVAPAQLRFQDLPQQPRMDRLAAVCNCQTCRPDYRYAEQIHRGPDWEQSLLEERACRKQIDERAEETLRMVMKPDELAHYEQTNEIVVTASDGDRYRIETGLIGNVRLLNESDEPVASLCCHPNLYPDDSDQCLPYRDAYAAQILYLRHDLDNFWKIANVSWHSNEARVEYISRRRGRKQAGVLRWLARDT